MEEMPRIRAFDRHYQQYDDWFDRNALVYQSEVRAIRHFLHPAETGLEIGAGSGRFCEALGIRVGIEPSEKMRELAAAREVKLIGAVAERLPFRAESFDYALMVTTLCFVDDVKASFREAARVLKPGGCFIVGLVDRDSQLGGIYREKKSENVFYRDATFYSVPEVLNLLRSAELGDADVIQSVFGRLADIRAVQEFQRGHGRGGFVVVRTRRGN
jgi:SAM-dependent methyltransferase